MQLKETSENFNILETDHGIAKVWNKYVPFEESVYTQAANLLALPFTKAVSLMPDAHFGMGSCVGAVIATDGAVVPSAVGSDLGCGIRATRLNIKTYELNNRHKELFNLISKTIPNGRTDNGGPNDVGRWKKSDEDSWFPIGVWDKELKDGYKSLDCFNAVNKGNRVTWEHLGSLGTGNHFLEVCSDEENKVWVLLHSGSRGVGARIGNYYMRTAKELCKKWFVDLPDPNLAYLPRGTEEYDGYIQALNWAQKFAFKNREIMNVLMIKCVEKILDTEDDLMESTFDCHHNYATIENHGGKNVIVTRKGAVRARIGDKCIIPANMGQGSYICEGLGNKDSMASCSHGAGRAMSRTAAKKMFTVEDHKKATEGVMCLKTEDVLDETSGAYKDIDAVMASESDLVKPIYRLKQFVCVKGI